LTISARLAVFIGFHWYGLWTCHYLHSGQGCYCLSIEHWWTWGF